MKLGLVAMDHAQDHEAEKTGVMHEGDCSRRWGLPGIPSAAETRIIDRDIRLARDTGGALHIQHISSAEGAERVRLARREGLRVTAEATPHHLALCDEDIDPANADYKMNPPLRAARDRAALIDAIADGTITCLATDHAPHAKALKDLGFLKAPFGVVGLETAVGVTYDTLVRAGRVDLLRWVRLWTSGPCAVLGLAAPTLADGARADLVLLDLHTPWTVEPDGFRTRSRNSPFAGRRLAARAVVTIRKGRVAWSR
jgi:dihydroorotase